MSAPNPTPATQRIQSVFSAAELKHGTSLFKSDELDAIDNMLIETQGRFFIRCQIKNKLKVAKPEEIVRQLWIHRMIHDQGYPKERIEIERGVYFGSGEPEKFADIVVLHSDLTHPYIIFEVKRPKRSDGLEQLKSYCNAEGAPIGVWSNGNEMIRLHREEPNIFVEIPRLPRVTETLRDILTERWTLKWLEDHDELKQGKTTLKKIILDLEELVLGNAGVDPFEEIFKLVYSKLYDEWRGINDPNYQLSFFVGDRSPDQVKTAITDLLRGATRTWSGVFEPTDKIELKDDHLRVCVSFLEKIKLFNSNLQVIDEAFEHLIPQVAKKKEGQFFTPRPVVDMVVKMLNPKTHELVIDPACGSAGFLLHSVMWVAGGVITGRPLPQAAANFGQNNIFGIDFAPKAVKVAKAINLIVGDGKSHVYKDNSLAPQTWTDETKSGLRPRLSRFPEEAEKDAANQTNFLHFDFDVLMTNPPFAGTVKQREILRLYKLAEKNGRLVNKMGRHILFLNRCLFFLRPGGRMAIVLPQGLLNNMNTEYIRRFVMEEARILAVVGLHGNTFKPHTGTKTSVLFLQKHTEKETQRIQEIRARYETEWEGFFRTIAQQYPNVDWDNSLEEKQLPEELRSFVEAYFETDESEELADQGEAENSKDSQEGETQSLQTLVEEMQEIQGLLKEKQEQFESAGPDERNGLGRELRSLTTRLEKAHHVVSERTLAGQIWLVLNDETIKVEFKKFWLDAKVVKETDYPIFFGVNRTPLKDESGEYRNMTVGGRLVTDENGHPVIEHDLDEIASAFVEFAKKQRLDFWSD